MEVFGARLHNLRQQNKIKQIEHAKELGVSQSNISFWEQDKSEPNIFNLIKIARFFAVTTNYLLGLSPKQKSDYKKI